MYENDDYTIDKCMLAEESFHGPVLIRLYLISDTTSMFGSYVLSSVY